MYEFIASSLPHRIFDAEVKIVTVKGTNNNRGICWREFKICVFFEIRNIDINNCDIVSAAILSDDDNYPGLRRRAITFVFQ